MKRRPRRVEQRIAEALTEVFVAHGHGPVERIPVLGRTGPDLTWNEVGLIVDVKSRKQVPQYLMRDHRLIMGDLYLVPLELFGQQAYGAQAVRVSAPVQRWWDHMQVWTAANHPDGISALVLHKPGKAYKKSMLVYRKDDHGKLTHNLQLYTQ